MKVEQVVVEPFLKWAGGKQWLFPFLKKLLHSKIENGKYIEPFMGGGSIFFSILPKRAWLSDSNQDLIDTYREVKDNADGVIHRLKRFSFTRECYYNVRKSNPRSPAAKAARFIYLNRTCWNGLYRVNQKGRFNVPMGSFESTPDFVVANRLRAVQKALAGIELYCSDFEEACSFANAGDFVYLDLLTLSLTNQMAFCVITIEFFRGTINFAWRWRYES